MDLIFVGNFIDKSASAAIGSSSLLVTCLVGFFGGMSVGSGVVIGASVGSGVLSVTGSAIDELAASLLLAALSLHPAKPNSIDTASSAAAILDVSFFVLFTSFPTLQA